MRGGVDVRSVLAGFGDFLKESDDQHSRQRILSLLWRWQRDPDLSDESKDTARRLIAAHGRAYRDPRRGR